MVATSRQRKKDPGYIGVVVLKAPSSCRAEVLVNMPPPSLPMTTQDARVATLSRSLKKALIENQEKAELGKRRYNQSCGVEPNAKRQNRDSVSRQVGQGNQSRRNAPPPRWTDPRGSKRRPQRQKRRRTQHIWKSYRRHQREKRRTAAQATENEDSRGAAAEGGKGEKAKTEQD